MAPVLRELPSRELETCLGAAHAAAYRWLLESRLMAIGVGIAPA